jgi:Uma2 family endonuclease
MQEKVVNLITEEEYLEQERASKVKHDFYQGEIFAMVGASERHSLIVSNVIGELRSQLKKTPCRVYPGDMRLKVRETGLYTYPDAMVICGKREFADDQQDTVLNPDVIIEILSDSTESYDRGWKFENYRKLSSLKEYVMISQNKRKIERYHKDGNGNWVLSESDEVNPAITIGAIDCRLTHSEVYDKVEDI